MARTHHVGVRDMCSSVPKHTDRYACEGWASSASTQHHSCKVLMLDDSLLVAEPENGREMTVRFQLVYRAGVL